VRQPDLVALQEVCPDLLQALRAERWIADGYQLSDAVGTTLGRYGNVLASRLPIERLALRTLPSIMGRRLLLADVRNGEHAMRVGVVHLESTREMAGARVEQLRLAFAALESASDALLVGDFNFDAAWPENAALAARYVDVWPQLRPTEPGWTEDDDRNAMRRRGSSSKKVRFDRVLLRSDDARWAPEQVELLGTEPVSATRRDVFVSDHFGIYATFEVRRHEIER
jgi:tyrosyl-DNA phosphodiesterase 2